MEQLTEHFMTREIQAEKTYDVASLSGESTASQAIEVLQRYRLEHMMEELPNFYYPRIIRLIYQTMTIENENIEGVRIKFTVDGIHYELTRGKVGDLSHTMGSYDNNSSLMQPQDHGLVEMLEDYSILKSTKNFTKRNWAPPHMKLVDHVFYNNISPTGHEQERRGRRLEALYAMFKGEFVCIPALIEENFTRAHYLNHVKRSTKGPVLKMPRFFTMFLIVMNHPFAENEPKVIDSKVVHAKAWRNTWKIMAKCLREELVKEGLGSDEIKRRMQGHEVTLQATLIGVTVTPPEENPLASLSNLEQTPVAAQSLSAIQEERNPIDPLLGEGMRIVPITEPMIFAQDEQEIEAIEENEHIEVRENDQILLMEMEYRDLNAQREGTPVLHFTESEATPVLHFTESETEEEEYHTLSIEPSPFEEMMITLRHSAPPATTPLQMEEEYDNYQQDKLPIFDPLLQAMVIERHSFEGAHYSLSMEAANREYQQPYVAPKTIPAPTPTKSLEQKADALHQEFIELKQKVDALHQEFIGQKEEQSEMNAKICLTMEALEYEVLMKGVLRRQPIDFEEDHEEEPAEQSVEEEEDFEKENEEWSQKQLAIEKGKSSAPLGLDLLAALIEEPSASGIGAPDIVRPMEQQIDERATHTAMEVDPIELEEEEVIEAPTTVRGGRKRRAVAVRRSRRRRGRK